MSSTPHFSLLTPLMEVLLSPNRALQNSLSLGESKDLVLQHLNGQRLSLLSQLSKSPIVEDVFKGTESERGVVLSKLWDAVFAAASQGQPGSQLAMWFGVLQRLSTHSSVNGQARFIELVMLSTSEFIGEQNYLRLLDSHDDLQSTVRAYQLQNRLSGQGKKTACLIIQEVRSASGGDVARWGPVDWSGLETALLDFFDQFATQPPRQELAASIAFLAGFLSRVVAVTDLPHGLWTLLLLRLDIELSKLSAFISHSFVSDVVECLVAGSQHLSVVGELIRRMQVAPTANSHVIELIGLQAVLGFAPEGRLSNQWLQKINIEGLRHSGLDAMAVDAAARSAVESMRMTRERHELDVLGSAAAVVSNWLKAADAANAIAILVRNANDSLASQLIERAADTDGKSRVSSQIEALLKVCVHASAIHSDATSARTYIRRQVALHLNVTKDIQVWKRHREIAARLGQLEVSQSSLDYAVKALSSLSQEIGNALSDQLKISAAWLKISRSPEVAGETVCSDAMFDDLRILVARYALLRRIHGSSGIASAMNRWYSIYLFNFSDLTNAQFIAAALERQIQDRDLVSGGDDVLLEFQSWVQQIHRCTAARNIVSNVSRVADTAIQYGSSRYIQRVNQGSAPSLHGGVEKAWSLGKLDCEWTLGRLSYVVCSGSNHERSRLWFWWQLGVGKNISRVPQEFIKAYLQALSEALGEQLHQDEGDWIFAQIFECYQRMFGLKQTAGEGELKLICPLLTNGPIWMQEISDKSAVSVFESYSTLLKRCCPDSLQDFAQDLLFQSNRLGDEEVLWQRQMPGIISQIDARGSSNVLEDMMRWQLQGVEALPLGVGALWNTFMTHGCQIIRQCSYGLFLAKTRVRLAEALAVYCPEIFAQYQGSENPSLFVEKMLGRLGLTLMSEPTTLAAINSVRILMWNRSAGLNLSRQSWRKLWSTLDAISQQWRSLPARQGSSFWTLQFAACSDELAAFDEHANAMFFSTDLVFAETQSEELRWRLALCGLIASTLMPDHAPINGKGCIGRIFLSCDVFEHETAVTWTQRGQAVLGLFGENASPGFKSRLAERVVQLGTLLYDRTRFQELPSVSGTSRYCVLMSGLTQARMLWGNVMLARYVDERKLNLSAEDAFIGNQLREPTPDQARATNARTTLSFGNRFKCPEIIERKKLLGKEKFILNGIQRSALTHTVRTYAASDFVNKSDFAAPLMNVVDAFAGTSGKKDSSNLIDIFLEQTKELADTEVWASKALRTDLGNAMAASRLLAQVDEVTSALVSPEVRTSSTTASVLKIRDTSVIYLAGCLNNLFQRPAGLSVWLFMSEEVMTEEWADVRRSLEYHINALASMKWSLNSADIADWGKSTERLEQTDAR